MLISISIQKGLGVLENLKASLPHDALKPIIYCDVLQNILRSHNARQEDTWAACRTYSSRDKSGI